MTLPSLSQRALLCALMAVPLVSCGNRDKNTTNTTTADSAESVSFDESPRVIVLVLDGVRTEESLDNGTTSAFGVATEELLPGIQSTLVPAGTLVMPGFAVGTTATAPGHFELITGTRQPFINAPDPDSIDTYRPAVPTLFEVVRQANDLTAEQALFIVNTVHLASMEYSTNPAYGEDWAGQYTYLAQSDGFTPIQSDSQVIVELIGHMKEHDTRLAIANLHQIDRDGHAGEEAAYQESIEAVDEPILALWDWVQSTPGYANNTTLILTSDHGRHRTDVGDPRWPSHSDQCTGCREIPIFLIGPDIKAGEVLDTPYMIADVAQTIAHLLGAELPDSTGVIMRDALTDPPSDTVLAGEVGIQATGGLTLTQRWLDKNSHRSEIVLTSESGTEVLSSDDSFLAEAPTLTRRNDLYYACWGELSLDIGNTTEYDWTPSCRVGAPGAWSDVTPPVFSIGSDWRPALAASADGSFWMTYTLNIDNTNKNISGTGLWVLRFNPTQGGWLGLETAVEDENFPVDASIAVDGEQAFVVYTSADAFESPRSTRNIRFYQATPGEDALTLEPFATTLLEDTTAVPDKEVSWPHLQSVAADRLERPAITVVDGTLHTAALAYSGSKVSVVRFSTDTAGETWTETEQVAPIGRTLANVTPQWSASGALVWARLSEGNKVQICRLTLESDTGNCQDTEAESIAGLSIDDETVHISVPDSTGMWTTETLSW